MILMTLTRTVEFPTAQTPTPETRTSDLSIIETSTSGQLALPVACGPVSAAIRATMSVSPDHARVILCLVGQIDRAIIASPSLLADEDLMLGDRMLEGLHENLWAGIDPRWVDDAELTEARSSLRAAMLEERDGIGG